MGHLTHHASSVSEQFTCDVPFVSEGGEGAVRYVTVTLTRPRSTMVAFEVVVMAAFDDGHGALHRRVFDYLDHKVTYDLAAAALKETLRTHKIVRRNVPDPDAQRLLLLDHEGYLAARAAELAQYHAATGGA